MSKMVDEVDLYCEQQGFVFHSNGRGKWGKDPYWTFGNLVDFNPVTGNCVISAPLGLYTGIVESVDHLRTLLAAMQIEPDSLLDEERAAQNNEMKTRRKMELTARVARKVEIHYGFRPEKALSMAMQGQWWRETTRLSQMTNRLVGEAARQVMEGIEKGTIN